MIQLSQVLSAEQTYMESFGASKKRILQTLAERLSQTLDNISDLELFDQLIARERLGSTGIGSGVAVPHCRLEGLEEPIAALVKIPEPVDFDSIDKSPVDLIFALIVPSEATDEHLQLLASVVEQVNDPANLTKIRNCKTPTELYNLFIGN
ncbi:PTS sugar transporter subunit IIA [Reinekea marinisedimentorum]|uniref:PTS system nitrogen regulatory IIA component n=1 Tax=Reinekea marinisedimentorum TaxID=230495 RepID=A0A4R3HZ58_9GAMM|nr:PTS sugar transporter subunit IIA [Reinekea marinisedimentorum]TCS37621.1 PTS system nitrogen regulatory IIA component [Reinekea marinisedimentorum]